MAVARQGFTATRLPNGAVLVAGGFASFPVSGGTQFRPVEFVEAYDPGTNTWSPRPSMSVARDDHTATLLNDGRVLVAGGTHDSAEIFDPAGNVWTSAAPMSEARGDHTATLLNDGRVLVAGGFALSGNIATAEVYDPATDTWSATGAMIDARSNHSATLLTDGRVLVVGGPNTASRQRRAEIWDPATGLWTPTPDLAHRRFRHTATRLPDGRVLATGGASTTAEIYDPVAGTWTPTGAMSRVRRDHTAVLTAAGEVLVAGGDGASSNSQTATAETHAFLTGTWTTVAAMAEIRTRHTAALLLPAGDVLVSGGATFGSDCCLATAERYGAGPEPVAFLVDTTLDSVDVLPGDGVCSDGSACSLRAAVMEANALPGANIVSLPAGTYSLHLTGEEPGDDNGALSIEDALTINGVGDAPSVIDASGIDRVLRVDAGRQAELNGVVLRNGDTDLLGGGIYNGGALTVRNSEISGSVSRSSFAGGGGIYNAGQATIAATTIGGNRARQGGGIYNVGQLTVLNSTVSGNVATDAVGPSAGFPGRGGGIVNDVFYGNLVLSQSTVAGNAAEGSAGGVLNTCGGEFCGVTAIDRSIVALNAAPSSPNCLSEFGSFGQGLRSEGHNVFGDVGGCTFAAEPTDLLGADPKLAPLAGYGGPTRTHALLNGSPAIDRLAAGSCLAPADQRGVARPQGAACDSGAYEAGACTLQVEARPADGVLALAFVIGAREPGRFTTLARIGGESFPLWSVDLGVVDPPAAPSFVVPIPAPPNLAIVSRIDTAGGAVCMDADPAN